MLSFWILLTITLLLITAGIVEAQLHKQNLSRIQTRIHVNGTRGKSSVTRLIAAGLRAGGLATCAKTTGTLPRMILPDGTEYPVYRPARANVIEQIRIVDVAVATGADCLVIECMALQPYLQWISESKLVRATHGVITNAREDHLDVMGPGEPDVARALAGMTPENGKLFTGRTANLPVFEQAARDRNCEFSALEQSEIDAVTESDMAGFTYVEHRENVALALKICGDLGIERSLALGGMQQARPDPGAMTYHEIDFFGRRIFFVNAFAANDPESTEFLWDLALDKHPRAKKSIALFNCRRDRQDRSRQLGAVIARWKPADHYILMGTGTFIFARAAAKQGMDMLKFSFAENLRAVDIFEMVVDLAGESALVVGMGNIGGPGLDTARYFRNRSLLGVE